MHPNQADDRPRQPLREEWLPPETEQATGAVAAAWQAGAKGGGVGAAWHYLYSHT
ncbi:MAG: hypothetical protein PHQ24_09315 [Proteiniphilum sp.]|nr:hypothetical protein [Proteiniphilum sp.]